MRNISIEKVESTMHERFWILAYDSSFGYGTYTKFMDCDNWGTAKSIAKHYNSLIADYETIAQCALGIHYIAERDSDYDFYPEYRVLF